MTGSLGWALPLTMVLLAGCSGGIRNAGDTSQSETATPTFYPEPGTYTSPQKVAIADASGGATIYYTTDGSSPTLSSLVYSGPISVAATTTINAMAAVDGEPSSKDATGQFTLSLPVAPAPNFSITAGAYTTSQSVSLLSSVPGAKVYFTVDGSVPNTASTLYTVPILISSSTTVRAFTTAYGFQQSPESDALYSINYLPAASPLFAPLAGTFTTSQNISITTATPNASIYFTTDGSTPTSASQKVTSAIPLSSDGSTTIKAVVMAPNFNPSAISSATYVLGFPAAPAPTSVPAAGAYMAPQNVVLTDAAPGASIFYTLDGSVPTTASIPYTGAIQIAKSTTVNAVASAPNFTLSLVGSAGYTFYSATPRVTISPDGGSFNSNQSVILSDALAGSVIYYTLDGSTPDASAMIYAGPILLTSSGTTTVKALATSTSAPDSDVSSASFVLTLPVTPSYTYKNVQVVGGGFIDGLYFHPAQQGLMYAHTDIGGAYRWNAIPGGDTQWVPLNDSIGRFNSGFDLAVQSLAIDPSDATRLYLAVGAYTESYGANGAVLASADMGKSFTPTPLPFKNGGNDSGRNDGDRLVVDPNNGKHLYLGTFFNGLYESLDRAATWKQVVAFPITGSTSNLEDPEAGIIFEQFVTSSGTATNGNTKTVYYGVSSPTTGLYVSQDGGTTFATVPGQPTGYYPNAESFDTAGNVLYVSYAVNQGCLKSCGNSGLANPNAGQLWSYKLPTSAAPNGIWTNITPPQTTPIGGAYGFNSVAVDPNHSNVIVATTLNKYYPAPYDDVFRSTDSGATWFNLNTNAVHDVSAAPWVSVFEPGNWFNHFVIDPFDSNHALYGDGETIWATTDLESADGVATSTNVSAHGNVTHWSVGAAGIEETAILALVSPPTGPAHLLSEMYDLGGFTHTDVDASPQNGQQKTPLFTTGTSIDFAENNPLFMARVGQSNSTPGTSSAGPGSLRGAYSTDGGLTWAPFANDPGSITVGAGTVAVSADASTIVWMPADGGQPAAYTTDDGTTWKASTGGPVQSQSTQAPNGYVQVYADRVNPKKFYLFDSTDLNGKTPIYLSLDGGHTYSLAAAPSNYDTGMAVSPNAEGDLWLIGNNGLYHSTSSGSTITQVSGIDNSFGITFGAAAPTATYPAIYLVGHTTADTTCVPASPLGFSVQTQCVYRSIDGGKTFLLISDFAHQYGEFNLIAADPRVFGRVYFGTNGRGIIEADSPN